MSKKQRKAEQQAGSKIEDQLSLKSPRTVEACRRQGYLLSELKFIPFDRYKENITDSKLTLDIIELRFKASDERRKIKIKNVMNERKELIQEEENMQKVKNSAPGKSRRKLDQNKSLADMDYSSKKITKRNKDVNNRSASFLSHDLHDSKPLAVEIKLNRETQKLKNLKMVKKKMIDSYIKKVIQDEEDKNERELILLKKREEAEMFMKKNEENQNRFHDQMAKKRAHEQFEKQKKKEQEIRHMKEESIKKEKVKVKRIEEDEVKKREEQIRAHVSSPTHRYILTPSFRKIRLSEKSVYANKSRNIRESEKSQKHIEDMTLRKNSSCSKKRMNVLRG